MAFMEPFIYYGQYYRVETTAGDFILPADDVGTVEVYGDLAEFVEGEINDPEAAAVAITGYYGRMSAPGYMDCTDWTAGDSEEEILDEFREYYGMEDDAEGDDEPEDGPDWQSVGTDHD